MSKYDSTSLISTGRLSKIQNSGYRSTRYSTQPPIAQVDDFSDAKFSTTQQDIMGKGNYLFSTHRSSQGGFKSSRTLTSPKNKLPEFRKTVNFMQKLHKCASIAKTKSKLRTLPNRFLRPFLAFSGSELTIYRFSNQRPIIQFNRILFDEKDSLQSQETELELEKKKSGQ